jgi:transcriptional regulator with XRE-family HTH domain
MKFQERFNEIVKISGKKQTEIAQAVGVSKQCVSDYKSGKSVPSVETLFLLCRYLDVSADYLLGLSNDL